MTSSASGTRRSGGSESSLGGGEVAGFVPKNVFEKVREKADYFREIRLQVSQLVLYSV